MGWFRSLRWTVAFSLLALSLSPAASAAVIYVNGSASSASPDGKSWSTAYTTIQSAINAAANGDEVWVAKGMYTESVTVTKVVALYGGFNGTETQRSQRDRQANVTWLNANQAQCGIYFGQPGVTVDGFTIWNAQLEGIAAAADVTITNNVLTGNGSAYGVVDVRSGRATITGNTISDNTGVGIFIEQGGSGTISANVISGNESGINVYSSGAVVIAGNTIRGSGGGILVANGQNVSITGNTFVNLTDAGVRIRQGAARIADNQFTSNMGGVHVESGSATVTNNTFTANMGYTDGTTTIAAISAGSGTVTVNNCIVAQNLMGVYAQTGASITLHNSDVWGNAAYDYRGLADPTGMNGNISQDPVLSNVYHDTHLQPGSPCVDAGDSVFVLPTDTTVYGKARIVGARVDIGADESDGAVWPVASRILYVQPTGNDSSNGTSWALARQTIGAALSAAQGGDEVWVAAGAYPTAIALPSGVSLYGGFAGTETVRSQRNPGANPAVLGAVSCPNVGAVVDGFTIHGQVSVTGTATISSNTVSGATGYSDGAGVKISGSATLRNNTISGNTTSGSNAVGGGVCVTGNATLTGNTITGNHAAYGAGIAIAGTATLTGNTISGNVAYTNGGGVYVSGTDYTGQTALATLTRNAITGNSASNGGGIYANSGATVILSDSLLSANYAAAGGALLVKGGTVTATNCTITGNAASSTGFTVSATSTLALTNCVVAFNTSGVSAASGASVSLRANDVYGNGSADYSGITDPTGTGGNISQDPRLANIYHDTHLQPGSPCIDAGDDTVIAAGDTDLFGRSRVIGAHTDIGADESDGTVWSVAPRIWHVSTGGDDAADGSMWATAKKTVGAAIAVAQPSDEVWVAKGTYPEAVAPRAVVALYGGFAGTESARGQRAWKANGTILAAGVRCDYASATVDGFTTRGSGIGVYNGSARIVNNTISASPGYAIMVASNGSAVICNNIITGNATGVGWSGPVILNNNTITANMTGVYANQPAAFQMTNNLVAFNAIGVSLYGVVPTAFSNNDVFGNTWANYSCFTDPTGQNGNISVDPMLSNLYHDIHLQPASPCRDAGLDSVVGAGDTDAYGAPRIIGAHVDIGADESDGTAWTVPQRVWRVSTSGDDQSDGASWQTAKRTVNGALSAAMGGDELWVAKGTYAEAVYLSAGVAMYGGFAGAETARSQRDWKANATSLTNSSNTVTSKFVDAVVDGFSIASANATGVSSSGAILLANDTISGSYVHGLDIPGGVAVVSNCTISGNKSYGIRNVYGSLSVSGSKVSGNAYGFYTESGSTTALTANTITGNGLGGYFRGDVTLTNNLVAGSTNYGVKVFSRGVLVNNTIAGSGYEGVYVSGTATLTNNIVAFNQRGVEYAGSVVPTMSHNDVVGNATANYIRMADVTGQNGNLSSEPYFVNRTGGDYHLAAGSPCINAGDDTAMTPGQTDLGGKPRKIGSQVDIGAYEYGTPGFTIADAVKALSIAGGLSAASTVDRDRLAVVTNDPAAIDLRDAMELVRKAAGMEANP